MQISYPSLRTSQLKSLLCICCHRHQYCKPSFVVLIGNTGVNRVIAFIIVTAIFVIVVMISMTATVVVVAIIDILGIHDILKFTMPVISNLIASSV